MSLPSLIDQGHMLATPSKTVVSPVEAAVTALTDSELWSFEFKFDGIRAMAFVFDGVVRLVNRNGVYITHRYPEVRRALQISFATTDVVLDGEVVCFDTDGRQNFAATHRRDAQSKKDSIDYLSLATPATFVAFDVLYREGIDFRRIPYKDRHRLLEMTTTEAIGPLEFSHRSNNGDVMWQIVRDQRFEGLIAKKRTSRYIGKRSADWIKLKVVESVSAVVTGKTEGKGWRKDTFGSLVLHLVDDAAGAPLHIGEVGTGFNEVQLGEICAALDAGQLLVVEVEASGVTKENKLRFPSFKGIRTDVDPTSCTTDQLAVLPLV